jgi:hypothetical protein
MTTITHAFSRTVQLVHEIGALERIAIVFAAGLLVSLVVMNCGLDLNTGFVGP